MALLLHMDWMGLAGASLFALLALFLGSYAAARTVKAIKGQKRTGAGNRQKRRAEQAMSRRRR